MEKICLVCGLPKDIEEFGIKRSRPDGHSSRCLLCTRDSYNSRYTVRYRKKKNRQRRIYREINAQKISVAYKIHYQKHLGVISELKKGPCKDCIREDLPPFCMEFDHRDPSTKFMKVSQMVGHFPLETVMEEIAKCDLVCRNCHRIRTKSRSGHLTSRRQLKLAFINSFKNKPCLDCSLSFSTECMDFDHAGIGKVESVTYMWSRSNEKIVAEIAKCDLVCAVCHAIRTHSRGEHLPKKAA